MRRVDESKCTLKSRLKSSESYFIFRKETKSGHRVKISAKVMGPQYDTRSVIGKTVSDKEKAVTSDFE